MGINDVLKELYKTITGKDATGMTISEIIAELNENYPEGGGGGSLPTPGTEGNVLTSNGTAWESAAPDKEIHYFGFSIGETMETDVSVANLIDLLAQNERVVAIVSVVPGTVYAYVPAVSWTPSSVYFSAIGNLGGGDTMLSFEGSINEEEDEWSPISTSPVVPAPTASDYLKILRVGRQSDGHGGYTYLYGLDNDKTPLIVHGTISGSTFEFTNTTVKDIYDAKVANRAVFLDDGDGFRWELTGAVVDNSTYHISFGCLKHGVTKIVAAIIGISGTADTTTGGDVIESDLTPNT